MKQEEKSNIIAAVGTVVVLGLVWVLLWFLYVAVPPQEQDEGIEVLFVEEEAEPEPPVPVQASSAAESAPALVEASPKEVSNQTKVEPLLTQEDEAALQIAKAEKEKERKQTEAIAKAQQFGSLFGNTNSDEVDNGTGGKGTVAKGNPLGHGSVGGNDWSLNGRHLVGALPKPADTFNQEGKVVVWITVNKDGNVVSARAGKGTTISDEATCQLAVKAALKAKFDMVDHPNAAMGTITYYFKNK